MEKFQDKYRIPALRWQNWDYGTNSAYYVTICTRNHECYFGNIVLEQEKTIQYSSLGSIAYQYWLEIPSHFPCVDLDAFIIMPNHVHGIIVINKSDALFHKNAGSDSVVETRFIASKYIEPELSASDFITQPDKTRSIASLRSSQLSSVRLGGKTGNQNPMLYQNLSRIIRWYKGRCSYEIGKISGDFSWQPRFHDRVIRNHQEYIAISDYINGNIDKWESDDLYKSDR